MTINDIRTQPEASGLLLKSPYFSFRWYYAKHAICFETIETTKGETTAIPQEIADEVKLLLFTDPETFERFSSHNYKAFRNLELLQIPDGTTEISDYRFVCGGTFATVEIPESVRRIGKNAFENQTALTHIIIPNGVESIGRSAFEGCRNLSSVTIAPSVTLIESFAFLDCPKLQDSKGMVLDKDKRWVLYAGDHLPATYQLPPSVRHIADHAFFGCHSLEELILPEGLISIGEEAFSFCGGLTHLDVPDSVTRIGYNAFFELASVTYNGNAPTFVKGDYDTRADDDEPLYDPIFGYGIVRTYVDNPNWGAESLNCTK